MYELNSKWRSKKKKKNVNLVIFLRVKLILCDNKVSVLSEFPREELNSLVLHFAFLYTTFRVKVRV